MLGHEFKCATVFIDASGDQKTLICLRFLIPDAILIASYTLGHTGPIGRREHERSPKDVNLSHLWTHRSFSRGFFANEKQPKTTLTFPAVLIQRMEEEIVSDRW